MFDSIDDIKAEEDVVLSPLLAQLDELLPELERTSGGEHLLASQKAQSLARKIHFETPRTISRSMKNRIQSSLAAAASNISYQRDFPQIGEARQRILHLNADYDIRPDLFTVVDEKQS